MMVLGTQSFHKIGEPGEVSSARRAGVELSLKLGFNEVRSGEVAILITEAATNISKHAKSGHIYLRALVVGDKHGIEILAVDSGPGIFNIESKFEDGNSSTNTYGIGLGAIKRLADFIDVYTDLEKGTVMLMTLWSDPKLDTQDLWEIGSMCIPIPSEEVCGDSWVAVGSKTNLNVLVADGLGHGQGAADASLMAVKALVNDPEFPPDRIMQNSHVLMRKSRGAAVAIAKVDANANQVRYCGIGNIAGCIYGPEGRQHLISHNGIVGTNMRKTQEFLHKWTQDSIGIMHSDGVGTKWSLENYPGLEKCHSSVIAAVIYRDFVRGRDDATIVVFKRQ